MKLGVVFPHAEIGNDPDVIRSFAQHAERIGYRCILSYDHVLGAVHADRSPKLTGPYTEATPFHEPLVLFGFLAAVTSSIELATGVLVLPQRQTALVAKQAAEIDVLTRGRLRLGIGTGWNYVEYDALNEEFSTRGQRQEEQVEVLRLLWSQPVVDYTGTWHRIDRAGILPRPERGIPIWLGGSSDAALRRAARIADGFIFGPSHDPVETIPKLRRYLEEAGRDPSSFGFDATVSVHDEKDGWQLGAERLREAGATVLSVSNRGRGLSPQGHLDALSEQFEALESRGLCG